MAGNGPAPHVSRVRSRDTPKRSKLLVDDEVRGPELPDAVSVLPARRVGSGKGVVLVPQDEWHPMTVRWWESWRRSPQAALMASEPDWDFLVDTALMHHMMWSTCSFDQAAEVRLRVAKFGATPEDRLRIKAEIELPEVFAAGDGGAAVTDIGERRKRLAGG